MMSQDEVFMYQALQLAQSGQYSARPNPMVGAVLVQNGHIIGQAFHAQAGTGHAESLLFQTLNHPAEGATLYVTLEPCCHYGRTPPCVDEIIARKVKRVVVATEDHNPAVNGQGIHALKAAGIEVTVGVLKQQARTLNSGFFLRMKEKRPFMRAKVAMSLDGKVAMQTGESQWITSEAARQAGHLWRARSGAMLTTVETVLQDNCQLTVRCPDLLKKIPKNAEFFQPLKVIVDQYLSVPPQASIFDTQKIVIAVGPTVSKQQKAQFIHKLPTDHRVEILHFPLENGHIAMHKVMAYLAECEINDVLIEAGPRFLTGLLKTQQVDELLFYIAPDLMGIQTLGMQQLEYTHLSEKLRGEFCQIRKVGRDLEARVLISDWAKTHSISKEPHQEFLCSFIP